MPVCLYVSCTDFSHQIDGYIARNFKGQSSMLGSVLDPLADKVLISVLTVTLTMSGLLPGKCFCSSHNSSLKSCIDMIYIQCLWLYSFLEEIGC